MWQEAHVGFWRRGFEESVNAPYPISHSMTRLCKHFWFFYGGAFRLGERPCHSTTQLLVRLYLVSLLEHASAWLAEDRKQLGDGPPLLSLPLPLTRRAFSLVH